MSGTSVKSGYKPTPRDETFKGEECAWFCVDVFVNVPV